MILSVYGRSNFHNVSYTECRVLERFGNFAKSRRTSGGLRWWCSAMGIRMVWAGARLKHFTGPHSLHISTPLHQPRATTHHIARLMWNDIKSLALLAARRINWYIGIEDTCVDWNILKLSHGDGNILCRINRSWSTDISVPSDQFH